MRDYELVVLLPVGGEETILSQVQNSIEQNKGKVGKTEKWGTKALSYPVAKLKQASFFLLNVSIAPEGAVLMERTLRVNESVIRYLFVRKEKGDGGHKGKVIVGRVQEGKVDEVEKVDKHSLALRDESSKMKATPAKSVKEKNPERKTKGVKERKK